jgi:hypothetical protein
MRFRRQKVHSEPAPAHFFLFFLFFSCRRGRILDELARSSSSAEANELLSLVWADSLFFVSFMSLLAPARQFLARCRLVFLRVAASVVVETLPLARRRGRRRLSCLGCAARPPTFPRAWLNSFRRRRPLSSPKHHFVRVKCVSRAFRFCICAATMFASSSGARGIQGPCQPATANK